MRIEEGPGEISGDKFSILIFIFCILLILVQVSMILVSIGKLPPRLPLFYSRVWGEAMLAPSIALWILPIIAAFAVIVNFLMAIFVVYQSRFLSRILVIFSFLVVLTTLYGLVKLISLLT
ncbi:hypothetical protein A2697_00415 [Candidatus Curtissbacteria bacterium RIFCSPHIGHO2_01_FULL_41_44]|uniref:Uncharacterized protein n=1 Tax=Candidatus Curtissbacteria bacterium RIFCSPLOWO2_01_FULL_42_50 TaxID=1797730 RepID=A0A1F5H4I8_9BACT|nr:MAG: hypothetical protein A2697_00415 [Candidatus Curtissbacteria bacterium RIFCSPHIGHO2_01_FULL_41_44]OGD93579.1 MAG: hypothetical protein A3C33_01525 [Candidatus Curtissbacteria bacterium RIFCSPHIGHO2_02_FULL_42_58]OGD97166.1 MAG: hypothetical protein A3E71_04960 [Candidatus Curtissbacteria bacterium RIFCSPHIGHO2_12_FULL_42_33]OGD99080.1 MAG: hypothetical protein A3B54_05205 [Candidatus Curtissbacteria bacterium RIFCSPLOWO2_01_FULL_42_50]OGE02287.1 MAG: hypothetical protein A3G16_01330 [Ca